MEFLKQKGIDYKKVQIPGFVFRKNKKGLSQELEGVHWAVLGNLHTTIVLPKAGLKPTISKWNYGSGGTFFDRLVAGDFYSVDFLFLDFK